MKQKCTTTNAQLYAVGLSARGQFSGNLEAHRPNAKLPSIVGNAGTAQQTTRLKSKEKH